MSPEEKRHGLRIDYEVGCNESMVFLGWLLLLVTRNQPPYRGAVSGWLATTALVNHAVLPRVEDLP